MNILDNFNFQPIFDWLSNNGVRVLITLIVAFLIDLLSRLIIGNIIAGVITRSNVGDLGVLERKQRAKTVRNVFEKSITVIVIVVVIIVILNELGIKVSSLLVGAGVIGIVVGLGAQSIIKDFLNGFFILVENQYDIGDVVEINKLTGTVTEFNFRRTVIRSLDGIEHTIPNGKIGMVSNRTKHWSKAMLDVPVDYDSDVDKVMKIIDQVGEELAKDKDYKDSIINPLHVLGLDDFSESGLIFKVLGKTKAQKQWRVKREFRRRLKKEFDKEGIEIPYPHRVIIRKK
ncbi:mechanosensitive ion channel family protein [Patescibacteria group bacterium]